MPSAVLPGPPAYDGDTASPDPWRPPISRRVALAPRIAAAVAGVLLLSALVAPVLAADPPRLEGSITDSVEAIGDREAVQDALDELLKVQGIQLFVVFTDTTVPLTATEFVDETARLNSLGADDALLMVALDDRTDAIWVSDSLPISDDELNSIIADTLEPALRDGDFGAAVIVTAEALGAAVAPEPEPEPEPEPTVIVNPEETPPPLPGGPTGGFSIATFVGLVLLALGIVIVFVWIVGRVAAWRETGERSRRLANLARDANAKLIAADERIRAADQETGFVEAEYGESEAIPFRAAVEEAKRELRAGFALRQRLDDGDPEDPPTREAMLTQIVECCARADAALDAQVQRIEELRSLERDAPTILAALPMQLEAVERRLPGADRMLDELGAYADAAWASVRGNAVEARKGLAGARAAIDRGLTAVSTNRSAAVREIVLAQRGVAGAAAMLDAIEKVHAALAAAAAGIPAELEAAARDLADAEAATDASTSGEPDPYAVRRDQAERDLATARRVAVAAPFDPLAAARHAATAQATAADLLASVRRDVEQAARFAAALDATITAARAEIDRASGFIATRHGGVRRRARTRLAEAERRYERRARRAGVRPQGGTRPRAAGRSPRGRGVHPRDDGLRALGRGAWRRLELRRGRRWLDPRRDHRRHPRRRRTGRRLGRIAVGRRHRRVPRADRSAVVAAGVAEAGAAVATVPAAASVASAAEVAAAAVAAVVAVATPVAGAGDEPRNRPRIDTACDRQHLKEGRSPWRRPRSSVGSDSSSGRTSTPCSTLPRIPRRCSISWSATSRTTSARPRRPSPRRSATSGSSRTMRGRPARPSASGAARRLPRRVAQTSFARAAIPRRPTDLTGWPRSPSAARSDSRARPARSRSQVAQQSELAEKLKDGLNKLRARREELVQKRDELVSRAKMAQAQGQVQEALKSASILDPTSELSRFEERIRRQEAQVRGMEEVAASSLDEQFASLEGDEDELEVEARLAALKTGG